ncbi:LOW QUALITY PROTEIN: FAST kinase domain-containing protein 1, mitochondrial-like [Bufo gargarizans]|uniref:LOW QUALITY PROTEIN: FAST kinase domain-containing protein 1, mitochondrial-like n=1 Tax=Bufo gargarizans TaxID=30331 RepID=UPI001CF5AF74|nr:LOW QUALITY PROTEIN: FAST kinase domain-containing protein 1, mitochondrial-like [Bufo gargarizans]
MFCWKRAFPLSLRFFPMRSLSSDPLLHQLMTCTNQFQIFQLVGIHKSKLTVQHVGCAINTLWEIQKETTSKSLNFETIRNHPEFIALRILAENKIDFMNDTTLVNTLYAIIRFNVEAHDSLVQQLLVEGWRRLERFEPETLSKFSVCLEKTDLDTSPLMGEVTNALSTNLDDIQNIRILSNLMVKTFPVTSTRLQHRLIKKAESLMETSESRRVHSVRRIVQFLFSMKYDYQPLLDKCNQVFVRDIKKMSTDTMCIVTSLYRQMSFKQFEFQVMAKSALLEFSDLWNTADHFGKIFCALFPMASQETRNKLEDDLVILADKIHHISLVYILETMAEAECRNPMLIQKICSTIQDNLDHYQRLYLCKITDALVCLPCQNYQLFADLQKRLTAYMKTCYVPTILVMMTRSLSLLTLTKVDEAILTKIDAVIPQCDLSDLNSIANSVIRWLQPARVSRQNKSGLYEKLLHKVSRHGLERVKNIDNLDNLLNELTYMMNGQWLHNMLLDDILHSCQRLLHQVTWRNAPFLALVISYCNTLCPPVLDKIAEVTMENVTKIHPTDLNRILYAFINLNYDPPREEEFFNLCIQHILVNLNSFPPHLMVLVGFTLAVAQYFPEELIKSIFNIGFLTKLDSELDTFPSDRSSKIRMRLMQLNRAVCLECPEHQVPWFHEEYCRQMKQRDANSKRSIYHQIHLFLGDLFGGINYAKMFVTTPYYYTVDFECILSKNKKPIAYMEENKLSSNVAEVQWGLESQIWDNKSLPQGAQRVAIEFLNPVAFCRNSSKIKGLNAMKKRHLEILGYYVVQIPSFEWNSMELGTKDAWINYLRKKIFANEL